MNKSTFLRKVKEPSGRFIAVSALLLFSAGGLTAQEGEGAGTSSAPSEAGDGVEVVVTAGRTKESELDTPAHVTIISGEEIMASGEQSLVGVLDDLAGVNFTSYAGPEKAQIDMRGFGENSHGRVLVMVDGRRLNSQDMAGIQWLSIPLESIERVEVVRGGSSVLYGNHAVGGVVNVVTKDSEEEYEFASTIDFGSYYSNDFENGVFSSQRLRFGTRQGPVDGAISFAHSSNEGYRERTATRSVNTHADGGWNATDIIRVELDIGYDWTTYEMPGSLPEAQYESDPSVANNDADEAEEHSLNTALSLQWFPLYNTEVTLNGGYRYQAKEIDMESYPSYTDRIYHSLEGSPKLTVEGETASLPWKVVTGADVYYSDATIVKYTDKKRTDKDFTASLDLTSLGGYVRPSVEVTRRLRIEGGIRYDYAHIAGKNDKSDVDDSAPHHAVVYDGALLFRPVDGLKLYAKGGTLFRYPFTDEQAVVNYGTASDGFNTDLDPETGINAEAGGTLSLEELLTLRANGYFLEMEDEIAYSMTTFQNENLDKTRRWGADVELDAQLHRMLGLTASYGFVDARFEAGDNEGNRIPLVPAHSVDAGLTIKPISTLRIKPEASFRSEAYKSGDEANEFDPIEQYWLFNLELSYAPQLAAGDMQVKLKIDNMLDELYSTFATDYGFGSSYYPGAGRSVSLLASYSY